MWLYEIDETVLPRKTIEEIDRYGRLSELLLSARVKGACKLVTTTTEPLPPGLSITVTCFGPKPPRDPDEMVEELKLLVSRVKRIFRPIL